jgi:competence protein ComEC
MISVLQALPVERVIASLPPDDSRLAPAPRHEACAVGQRWAWDDVGFEVLHPQADSYNSRGGTERAANDNDLSCVLRVTAAGASALLTGDIEQRSERELLQRTPAALRSDVLLVPHHGSATSSSDAFLRHVQPTVAVFSVGYRNRFGHPAPAVLERYRRLGSRIYRSDVDGAVRVRIGADISVAGWRQARPRYWQGR